MKWLPIILERRCKYATAAHLATGTVSTYLVKPEVEIEYQVQDCPAKHLEFI